MSGTLSTGAQGGTAFVSEHAMEGRTPVRAEVSGGPTVLGLSFFFHDSAAAIVSGGRVVAAASEERFCRRKHTNEFPKLALEYCLEAAGLRSINDVDAVVFYEKPVLKLNRLLETLVDVWPRGLGIFARGLPGFLSGKLNVYSVIQKLLPAYEGPILFAEHHLSHAASAFYCSPFAEAAILTVDGVGEWETTAIGVGRGTDIQLDRAIRFPHSIGLLYSALTSYLGFQVNDGEWKVMGLAPYGEPKYADHFRRLVRMHADGSFVLNMDYFVHHYSSEWTAHNDRWEALFGFPRRQPKAEIEQRHEDLARSGQAVVEELILNLAREARRASGSENLVIAGGVGLNSVANWRIEQEGIFKNVWIQPAAGDDGGALGAALLASHVMFATPRGPEMTDAYLGPEYTDRDVLNAIAEACLPYELLDDATLVGRVADLIAAGKVVGWCRGRMEFGPRALGSRSILADATNAQMKAIINQKIKYREYFRPFAPAVPLEDVHRYFDVPPGTSLPFMLKVPKVRPDAVSVIPAVTHEDGTGRVQTVTSEDNPLYYALLKAVGRRTGVPVIVNTSFNVRGEPIVCTPRDAIDCFQQTGIDALVVGNCLLTEKGGAQLDVQHGYARSDALEAQIGATRRGAAAVVDVSPVAASGVAVSAAGRSALRAVAERPHVVDLRRAPWVTFYDSAVDMAKELRRRNRIKQLRPAHAALSSGAAPDVIGVGSEGWFAASCAYHYGTRATVVDPDPARVRQARSLGRIMSPAIPLECVDVDPLTYAPPAPAGVVSVFMTTPGLDWNRLVDRAAGWVSPGGLLQVVAYHAAARRPSTELFERLRAEGASEERLYEEFRRLNRGSDEPGLRLWFRQQVMSDPVQVSYDELADVVCAAGFEILDLMLDGRMNRPSAAQVREAEARREAAARAALRREAFDPGYITIWARPVGQSERV